jgi:hypothetical protein
MRALKVVPLLLPLFLFWGQNATARQRWTEADANSWYNHQAWLLGSNFIPTSAINQLEMWQAASFDPQEIDKELGWAEGVGIHARLPPRSSLGTGRSWVSATTGYLSVDCRQASHPANFCVV